jgi:tetrahydromethanopterin S-methyltransferase subunit G
MRAEAAIKSGQRIGLRAFAIGYGFIRGLVLGVAIVYALEVLASAFKLLLG